MAKRNQQEPAREQAGHNNPEKSTDITTGSYKKAPKSKDVTAGRTKKADSRLRAVEGASRSGSDSNAHKHRKASRLHEHHKGQGQQQSVAEREDFEADLHADNRAGENRPVNENAMMGLSANEIKQLHTTLADLTDDELKSIVILPLGSRLEQGAKYIDLQHLEQGEFVAKADMIADETHYYVPKKETDYVLWNRLNQVDEPERLDETEEQ